MTFGYVTFVQIFFAMDYTKEIFLAPNFNYKEFYDSGFLTDCSIFLGKKEDNPKELRAHILVLANSSGYFFDMFTGQMSEAETHQVYITHNPKGLLPKVIEFMYTGSIKWLKEQTMALYSIARFYKISELEKGIQNELNNNVNANNLMDYVDQCYDLELKPELRALESFIIKFYSEIPLDTLSEHLDVETFSHVLEAPEIKVKYDSKKLIQLITDFLQGYEFDSEEEKENLLRLLNKSDPNLKSIIKESNPYWIPESFVKAL